jgi:hypothetical protein
MLLPFILILCSISQISFGFFHNIDHTSKFNENSTLIRNFEIKYDRDARVFYDSEFPLKFSINIKEFTRRFNVTFQKLVENHQKQPSLDVFVIEEAMKIPIRHGLEGEEFQQYSEVDGPGFATLIRNKNNHSNHFRLVNA